jgi:predicted acetyltransferase
VSAFDNLPIDDHSRQLLAEGGLHFGLVDTADPDMVRRWLLAEDRGFHDPLPSDELLAAQARDLQHDRVSGVWDPTSVAPSDPIATVRSWVMGLTAPGGDSVPAWAISAVTVAPTHRRRGIARELLHSELRTAQRAGLPLAMLTVSEATIYSRFGFAPAADQATVTIETNRVRWTGPIPDGRLHIVPPASLLEFAPAIFKRARVRFPGEIDRRPELWRYILGLNPLKHGERDDLVAVRYDDAAGDLQGFAVYRFEHEKTGYPNRLHVTDLVAATDDAYAALWRYLIEMDLIGEVHAPLRSIDEPVAWQVSDRRAVRKSNERDQLWLRVLDVPAVLEERRYFAPGAFVLAVTDDLALAGGEVLLTVDADGRGHAHPLADGDAPADADRITLSIAELGALYLGGMSALVLARAGRIVEETPDAAARLDASFHSPYAPWVSTSF